MCVGGGARPTRSCGQDMIQRNGCKVAVAIREGCTVLGCKVCQHKACITERLGRYCQSKSV